MKRFYDLILIIICAALVSLNSGCYTIKTLHYAKSHYSDYKISSIGESFSDEQGNIFLNVTSPSNEKSRPKKYHIELNLDTVASIINSHSIGQYNQNDVHSHQVIAIYPSCEYCVVRGIEISFSKQAWKRGWKKKNVKYTTIPKENLIFDSLAYKVRYNHPNLNKHHISETSFIIFSLPNREKGKVLRYSVVPFATILDIITLPAQLIIAIFYANPYMFD